MEENYSDKYNSRVRSRYRSGLLKLEPNPIKFFLLLQRLSFQNAYLDVSKDGKILENKLGTKLEKTKEEHPDKILPIFINHFLLCLYLYIFHSGNK